MDTVYHIPALLKDSVEGLNIKPNGIYVDVTFGGGGHSNEILSLLGANGRLFGFDQDINAKQNAPKDERFTFVHGNFRYLSNFMRYYKVGGVDGILADLGVSFHHFDTPERGFSFRFESEMDMRMNPFGSTNATYIINTYTKENLATILYQYGELKNARRIADVIVQKRNEEEITNTYEFTEIVRPFLSRKQEKKELTLIFQALRMEVNQEIEALKEMLTQTLPLLKTNGRLVVISYHSLEDRLVKNFMRTGNFDGIQDKDFFGNVHSPFSLISRKQIVPTEEEILRNPRSRSAKLRIAEKKDF